MLEGMPVSLGLRMNNWTIRTRLMISVALILTLIVATELFAIGRQLHVQAAAEQLEKDSLPGLLYSGEIALAWTADYNLIVLRALGEQRVSKETVASELDAVRSKFAELITRYETTIFAAENRRLFEQLKNLLPTYLQLREQLLKDVETLTADQSISLRARLSTHYQSISQALQDVRASLQWGKCGRLPCRLSPH